MTVEVVDWAGQIAPARQPKDAAIKAVSEMSELLDAVMNKSPENIKEELGDMMILMVDLAYMYRIDLIKAGLDKMKVNRARAWEQKDGVMRRIR